MGAEVDPETARAVSNQVRQAKEEIAKAGTQVQLRADTARLHIAYDREGQSQEEWLSGLTFARGTPVPTLDMTTGRQNGQSLSYACGAKRLFGFSAPAGRLEANEKLFRTIVASIHANPDWQARVQQVKAQVQAIQHKGAMDRWRIRTEAAEKDRNIVLDTIQSRQAAQERNAEMWDQVIRGVEPYRNPDTGETVDLPIQWGKAWSNGRNDYIMSDAPNFDPNTVSRETWTQLEQVGTGK